MTRRGLGAGAALFAGCFVRSGLTGFGTHDESWFLQVLDRVKQGDMLYRDVFFGSTPLAVQALAPALRIAPSEILIVRAATAATTAMTALASCRVARRLRAVDPEASALLGLAVAVYGSATDPHPPYSPLAGLGHLVSLEGSLRQAQPRGTVADAAFAGLGTGVALAAKQNVGLATLAAMSLSLRPWQRRRRAHAGVAYGTAAVVLAGSLAPVLLRGGGPRFIEYAFTNKRTYLRTAGLSYLEGLRPLYDRDGLPFRDVYGATKFLVPPVAAAALISRATSGKADGGCTRRSTLAAYAAAAMLGTFPRVDETHLSWSLPTLLVALGWTRQGVALSPRMRRLVRTAAWGWLGLGFAAPLAKPLALWRTGRATVCRLPHFRGVLEDRRRLELLWGKAEALRMIAERSDAATFLLVPDAAQYYLLTGIHNPTPYDYPYVTAFGRCGQRETAAAIQRGEIGAVLVEPGDEQLTAWSLVDAVRAMLPLVAEIGGAVYARD